MDANKDPEAGAPTDALISKPESATDFAWSLVALGASLTLVWWMAPWHNHDVSQTFVPYAPIIPCLGIAIIFIAVQFAASFNQRGAGGSPRVGARPINWQRVVTRLCGVAATFALVGFVYWLLPEYRSDFYGPFWRYLRTVAPIALAIPFYLAWADRHFAGDDDDYLQFGYLVTRGWKAADPAVIRRHLLAWLVKAYFLPIMTVYLAGELSGFYDVLRAAGQGTLHIYQILFHLCYLTDLLFAVVGYTLTMRLFDTHMRSVEPTVAGWVVALICYQPFVSVTSRAYTSYDDKTYWDNLLQPWPLVQIGFGIAIVGLMFIYSLATAAFGIRFSNLTHRGIITSGPYRFSKHPAYLSKNLSWWLISVPMISELGWATACRNCCLLALLNLIYYARARTEERHLSRDPVYVAYALWMDQHGLLAPLSKWLPFIRFRHSPQANDRPPLIPSDAVG